MRPSFYILSLDFAMNCLQVTLIFLHYSLYECNSNCSCNKETCYNSVVQLGLQVRLELFMTEKKGWGVRSLDYIPAGTFICNYSGELMTKFAAEMVSY